MNGKPVNGKLIWLTAWIITLAIYALCVKVLIWAVAACNIAVLPFFPVFVGMLVCKLLLGRRG